MLNIFKQKKVNPNIYNEFIAMGLDEDTASQLTVHYITEFYKDNEELSILLKSVSAVMTKNKKLKRTFGLTKK